jgi:hypothetical protein
MFVRQDSPIQLTRPRTPVLPCPLLLPTDDHPRQRLHNGQGNAADHRRALHVRGTLLSRHSQVMPSRRAPRTDWTSASNLSRRYPAQHNSLWKISWKILRMVNLVLRLVGSQIKRKKRGIVERKTGRSWIWRESTIGLSHPLRRA